MVRRIKEKYKIMITIICVVILLGCISIYLYASEKKDNEDENEIYIAEENNIDTTTIPEEDNILIAMLSSEEETNEWVEIKNINELNRETFINSEAIEYYVDCTLSIPKIGLSYPVLSETSTLLLEHNLNKFWGCDPNEVGNYVIVGHNYNNGSYFGRLDELTNGDIIQITDVKGNTLQYQVYDMYYVDPEDVSCTSQLTNGKKEVTLITCNATGSQRLVVKTTEIK